MGFVVTFFRVQMLKGLNLILFEGEVICGLYMYIGSRSFPLFWFSGFERGEWKLIEMNGYLVPVLTHLLEGPVGRAAEY